MTPTPPYPPFEEIQTTVIAIDSIEDGKWKYTFQNESGTLHLNFDEELPLIGQTIILTYTNGNYEMEY